MRFRTLFIRIPYQSMIRRLFHRAEGCQVRNVASLMAEPLRSSGNYLERAGLGFLAQGS
jgi:hypothetical protein